MLVDFSASGETIIADKSTVNPDTVIAYGATKLARDLLVGAGRFVISDVNPLTLGTDVAIIEDLNFFVSWFRDPTVTIVMDPMINRNEIIPLEKEREYATTKNN